MRSRVEPQPGWLVADYHRGYDVERLAKMYDLPTSFIEELLEQDVYDWQKKVTEPNEQMVRKVFGDLKNKTYIEDPSQSHIRTKTYWRSLEEIAVYVGKPPMGLMLMLHTVKGNRIGLEVKSEEGKTLYRADLTAREVIKNQEKTEWMHIDELSQYTGYKAGSLPSMRLRSGHAKKIGLEKQGTGRDARWRVFIGAKNWAIKQACEQKRSISKEP